MNRPAPVRLITFAADSREPYRLDPVNVLLWVPITVAWIGFLAWLAYRVLS